MIRALFRACNRIWSVFAKTLGRLPGIRAFLPETPSQLLIDKLNGSRLIMIVIRSLGQLGDRHDMPEWRVWHHVCSSGF